MTGRKKGRLAFTLIEVMIVVAIIGLLAAIAIPNFVRSREHAQTNTCINNLRLIDATKQQWALEFRKVGSDEPTITELAPYLVRGVNGRLPACPSAAGNTNFDSSYTINAVSNPPVCVIASETHKLPL